MGYVRKLPATTTSIYVFANAVSTLRIAKLPREFGKCVAGASGVLKFYGKKRFRSLGLKRSSNMRSMA